MTVSQKFEIWLLLYGTKLQNKCKNKNQQENKYEY